MTTSILERETPRWSPTPPRRYTVRKPPPIPLKANGFLEIKPHTFSGISRGVSGIRKRLLAPGGGDLGLLVTYLPVDARGRAVFTGVPTHVHMFVATVTKGAGDTPKAYESALRWTHIGRADVRPTIPHPSVDQMSAFGQAIEPVVQAKAREVISHWYPKVKFDLDTGGHRPGPDVTWKTLAELYAELANELRDPFWRQLADEVAALR